MIRRALVALPFALAACAADPCEPGWTAITEELDHVALSVQGTSARDVWVVGGGLGLGGALARRWDGARWAATDLGPTLGASTSLWWVWPEAPGKAWVVGEAGAVATIDGAAVTARSRTTSATLYGVWGSGPADVWIVGGVANGRRDADDDLVWRWDGVALSPVVGVPSRGAALFKVWGSGPGDVWISGEGGTLLRWDGDAFTDHSAALATLAPVLTVHGCARDDVWAIAGQSLFHWDGVAWTRRTDVVIGSASSGVSCHPERVLVVGNAGLKVSLDRATGRWTDDRAAPPTATDLHGAWIDPDGHAWAVGGNFNEPGATRRRGVVGFDGCPRPDPL